MEPHGSVVTLDGQQPYRYEAAMRDTINPQDVLLRGSTLLAAPAELFTRCDIMPSHWCAADPERWQRVRDAMADNARDAAIADKHHQQQFHEALLAGDEGARIKLSVWKVHGATDALRRYADRDKPYVPSNEPPMIGAFEDRHLNHCHHCGTLMFSSARSGSRVCSSRCLEARDANNAERYRVASINRKRAARAKDRTTTCERCGTTFTPARDDAKACSPACRQALHRKRRSQGSARPD